MSDKQTVEINIPVLARVEGEGALDLIIENQSIKKLNLRIYEPPRYFEKFLEGRSYSEVPDIVARICGICPVAYQMSAVHALESIFQAEITPWIRSMRRLFYCGEWIQSHSLHIHLLAAPDYFGFNSVIEMSEQYPAEVQRGLRLQSFGNKLVALFGARSVHPVGVKVGGFYSAPDKRQTEDLITLATQAKQDSLELIEWVCQLDLPDDNQDFTSVALQHTDEYPFNEGRIVSDKGLNIHINEFEDYFKELHVDYSTALHCLLEDQPYLVGPLARLNLNHQQLYPEVKQVLKEQNVQFPSKNMFHSIIARAIEIYQSVIEADQLLSNYQTTDTPCVEVTPQCGTGFGCSEAPRGILWHRYDTDESGAITKSVIVPPTSQNQSRIEMDLQTSLVKFGLDKNKTDIQLHAEKIIRNYDPCISCATHFLNLNLIRDGIIDTPVTNKQLFNSKNISLSETAILGIGSPLDNDDIGWKVIDNLLENPEIITMQNSGLRLKKLDRPGMALADAIKNISTVFIIDAMKTDTQNKSIVWFDAHTLKTDYPSLSSHSFGLVESIMSIQDIAQLPVHCYVIGISESNDHLQDNLVKTITTLLSS